MTSFFRGAPLQTALLCGLFLVPTVTMAGPVADAGYELVRFEPGTYTMGDSELTPKPSEPRRGLLPPAMAAEIRAGVAADRAKAVITAADSRPTRGWDRRSTHPSRSSIGS